MLKSRVTDGSRTRDNRIHNPVRKKTFSILRWCRWALAGAQTPYRNRVGVPGPGMTETEPVGFSSATSGSCP